MWGGWGSNPRPADYEGPGLKRHRDVITLVAAALVLHRIHDHNRVHERCEGCSRSRRQAGELPLSRAIKLPPVRASDAELGPDPFPAHPLIRSRRTFVPVSVDASQELPLR